MDDEDERGQAAAEVPSQPEAQVITPEQAEQAVRDGWKPGDPLPQVDVVASEDSGKQVSEEPVSDATPQQTADGDEADRASPGLLGQNMQLVVPLPPRAVNGATVGGIAGGAAAKKGESGNADSSGNPDIDEALGTGSGSKGGGGTTSGDEDSGKKDDQAPAPVVRDKAGRKVSPDAAPMKGTSGNCTEKQHEEFQDDVDQQCSQPQRCKSDMDQVQLIVLREQARQCAMARDKVNNVCFAGGDKGHRDAAINAWQAVANCEGMMR